MHFPDARRRSEVVWRIRSLRFKSRCGRRIRRRYHGHEGGEMDGGGEAVKTR
jgi:hypothetical protein